MRKIKNKRKSKLVSQNKKTDQKLEKYREELNKLLNENSKLEKDIKRARVKIDSMKGVH